MPSSPGRRAEPRTPRSGLRRGSAALETMLQACRQPERLARVDRLGHVDAEPAPVDSEAEIGEPAGEPRQLPAGHATGSAADEPPLPGLAADDEVRAAQEPRHVPEAPRLSRLRVVVGAQVDMAAVLRLHHDHAIACRDESPGEASRRGERIAGALAELVSGERLGSADAEAPLHRQRVAAEPAGEDEAEVESSVLAELVVAPQIEERPRGPVLPEQRR